MSFGNEEQTVSIITVGRWLACQIAQEKEVPNLQTQATLGWGVTAQTGERLNDG